MNTDKLIIEELISRINFFKEAMEEHVLVAVIEQELAKHFEFQVLFNTDSSYTYWNYYIRCSIQYPWAPEPQNNSRLTSLLTNLELLRHTALNKD